MQQLSPNRISFLSVNFQDTPDAAKSYLSQFSFNQPVALDPRGDVAMRRNVVGLPTTPFVYASGVLRSVHNGGINA